MTNLSKLKVAGVLIALFSIHLNLHAQCWQIISANSHHTAAIKKDGTLWTWGYNGSGQLGIGVQSVDKYIPTQVGTENNWKDVSAGDGYTLALKIDGTLWAWGSNIYGNLGSGAISGAQVSPLKIGSDTDWKNVFAGSTSYAIKTNGTLWGWGNYSIPFLGNGKDSFRKTPFQVGTDTDWKFVTSNRVVMAIKSDSTLWGWGQNTYGEIGLGSLNEAKVPTKVGNDHNWISVSIGFEHGLGLKSDSTVWGWGMNDYYQLGIANTYKATEPKQLSNLNRFIKIAAESRSSIAIDTGNKIMGWGRNFYGELGNKSLKSYINNPTILFDQLKADDIYASENHGYCITPTGELKGWGTNYWGTLGNGHNIDTATTPELINCVQANNINVLGLKNFKVFPNPSNGKVIVSNNQTLGKIIIYNAQGQILQQLSTDANELEIYINEPGIYIIQAVHENSIQTQKIVIQY